MFGWLFGRQSPRIRELAEATRKSAILQKEAARIRKEADEVLRAKRDIEDAKRLREQIDRVINNTVERGEFETKFYSNRMHKSAKAYWTNAEKAVFAALKTEGFKVKYLWLEEWDAYSHHQKVVRISWKG